MQVSISLSPARHQRIRLDNMMTIAENIGYLLAIVENNAELHIIEQTIACHAGKSITQQQAELFKAECVELRRTEAHYER